jgi:hypothetical protein
MPHKSGMNAEILKIPNLTGGMTNVTGIPLLSFWSPTLITNKQGVTGIKLTLQGGQTALIFIPPSSPKDVHDWMLMKSAAVAEILKKGYGSWGQLKTDFSSDFDLMDAIIAKKLPNYFNFSSVSMQYPLGYYIFPLFPASVNYQKEYALFAAKAMLSYPKQPFLKAETDSYFFFIFQSDKTAEILYGNINSGAITGRLFMTSKKGFITKELIADVCSCITHINNCAARM